MKPYYSKFIKYEIDERPGADKDFKIYATKFGGYKICKQGNDIVQIAMKVVDERKKSSWWMYYRTKDYLYPHEIQSLIEQGEYKKAYSDEDWIGFSDKYYPAGILDFEDRKTHRREYFRKKDALNRESLNLRFTGPIVQKINFPNPKISKGADSLTLPLNVVNALWPYISKQKVVFSSLYYNKGAGNRFSCHLSNRIPKGLSLIEFIAHCKPNLTQGLQEKLDKFPLEKIIARPLTSDEEIYVMHAMAALGGKVYEYYVFEKDNLVPVAEGIIEQEIDLRSCAKAALKEHQLSEKCYKVRFMTYNPSSDKREEFVGEIKF